MIPAVEDLKIRAMRTQDIYAVQELVARDGDSLFPFVNLLAYCLQSGHEAFVAVHGSHIVGVVAGKHGREKSHVDVVCVAEPHRGHGVASTLLRRFRIQAKSNPVYLEVATTNLAAQKLYLSLGYETTEVIPRFYAQSDAFQMRTMLLTA